MTTTEPACVFTSFTHVTDATGRSHAFGPGDPVPGWALPLVGEHVITGRPQPATPAAVQPAGVIELVAPPTHGPGSSRPAWVAFAAQCGLDVPDEWTRVDIIDHLRQQSFIP